MELQVGSFVLYEEIITMISSYLKGSSYLALSSVTKALRVFFNKSREIDMMVNKLFYLFICIYNESRADICRAISIKELVENSVPQTGYYDWSKSKSIDLVQEYLVPNVSCRLFTTYPELCYNVFMAKSSYLDTYPLPLHLAFKYHKHLGTSKWTKLSTNPSIPWPFIINTLTVYPWDTYALSGRPDTKICDIWGTRTLVSWDIFKILVNTSDVQGLAPFINHILTQHPKSDYTGVLAYNPHLTLEAWKYLFSNTPLTPKDINWVTVADRGTVPPGSLIEYNEMIMHWTPYRETHLNNLQYALTFNGTHLWDKAYSKYDWIDSTVFAKYRDTLIQRGSNILVFDHPDLINLFTWDEIFSYPSCNNLSYHALKVHKEYTLPKLLSVSGVTHIRNIEFKSSDDLSSLITHYKTLSPRDKTLWKKSIGYNMNLTWYMICYLVGAIPDLVLPWWHPVLNPNLGRYETDMLYRSEALYFDA